MKGPVLVIEDDADIRESLKDVLELAGHSVVTAENGAVGMEKVKSATPSLILLDLYMPTMNGLEFLEAMGEELSRMDIPVVLCTAAHPEHDEYKRASQMVKGVIKKPVQMNEVLNWTDKFCS